MTIVMCFGTFDVLHEGHLDFFRQAKEYGDKLIVVVARDATTEEVKGKKPLENEMERLTKVSLQKAVDKTTLGNISDRMRPIIDQKPDVVCLGYDQKFFVDQLDDFIKKNKLKTKIIRLNPYKPEKYKSSIIKKKK